MKRILSCMQPTNRLHLGNYLGALKNWVALQDEPDSECLYGVVDLHAITAGYDPKILQEATREIAAAYIAGGVDPERATLFVQSAVPAHTELAWLFSCLTPLGWLNRMTQFKEKSGKRKDNASLGLYAYPVLMAADILAYRATHVPVGEDQKQHLELAREIAGSFNHHFTGDRPFFPLPEPVITGHAARVMSLRDGTSKMSKSAQSDMSRINLTDDADTIALKIRKAKTDAEPIAANLEEMQDRPEARNLITIYAALAESMPDSVAAEFAGRQFSDFKATLTELMIEKLAPVTARMAELMKDPAEIDRILSKGARQANDLADQTLTEVKAEMGFWSA